MSRDRSLDPVVQRRAETTLDPATAPGRRARTDTLDAGVGGAAGAVASPSHRWSAPTASVDEDTARAHGLVQFDASAAGGDELDGADALATAAHGVSGAGGAPPHLDTIQRSFGRHDVSGVSAHVGGQAAEASAQLGATAYATGNDVAFAETPSLFLASHELAHVVQQRGGVQLKGGIGQVGDVYEQHADAVAHAVVAGESAEPLLDRMAGGGGAAVQASAVQRDARPVVDRDDTVTFTQTRTYEAFLAEVRQWLARRVRSRSDDAHRERALIPDDALRGIYSTIRPGAPITLDIHRAANGFSYRSVTFVVPGEEIVITIPLEEETPSPAPSPRPDGPAPDGPTPDRPRLPAGATPEDHAIDAAQDQVADAVRDTIRDEIIEHAAGALGLELLADLCAVIGAISTCVTIFREIYELADPTVYSKARGLGAAVQANRIAEYVFTHGTGTVMGASSAYIGRCTGSPEERVRHMGEVMQDVLEELGTQWTDLRTRIDQAQAHPPAAGAATGRSFETQASLASYLVEHSINTVDVRMWRDRFHAAYQGSGSFALAAASAAPAEGGARPGR